tara:strand:+ start:79 stop:366 length:288 start_codon:yes stop_codon:yes gene_type:complete
MGRGISRKPKANKTYTLELETVKILEQYCAASDTWDKKISRSSVVNNAIKWYLQGDTAELVASQEALIAKVKEMAMARASPRSSRSWWRRLLGLN